MRSEFTTFQIAEIAKVSPRTVCQWIDRGKIKGAWRMPDINSRRGGRRASREALIEFFKQIGHTNALAALQGESLCRVLVAAPVSAWLTNALHALEEMAGISTTLATEVFEAAATGAQWKPHLTVIDFHSFGVADAVRLAQQSPRDTIIAVVGEDESLTKMQEVYLMARQHPVNPKLFASDIRRVVERRFGSRVIPVRVNPQ